METTKEVLTRDVTQSEEYKELKKAFQTHRRDHRFMKMRLVRAERRNDTLTEKLKALAANVHALGLTPVIDVSADTESAKYYGITDCARLCGAYSGRIVSLLQKHGVVRRGYRTLLVNEPYQDKGFFVYLYGVRNCYTRFYFKITGAGVAFIKELVAQNPAQPRYRKRVNTD